MFTKSRLAWLAFALVLTAGAAAGEPSRPADPAASHPIPSFTIPPAKPGVAYERFMVIGDFGTGRADQYKIAAAMAKRAKEDGLDFILTTGDNIYQEGVQSADDPQWKTKFEDVYTDQALSVPFYPTLGNHDHYGNPQAQIDYAKRNKNWKMPAPHYTFTRTLADGTRVQFFATDSYPIVKQRPDADAQLVWLDRELGKSNARWKIVYGHYPLYSSGERAVRGYYKGLIEKLEPLFTKHHVDVYLAGHDHHLEMLKPIKGVHYVISGAAAGVDKAYDIDWTEQAYYAATLGGFTLMRVSKDELVIEFVRQDGKTQYAHTLRK